MAASYHRLDLLLTGVRSCRACARHLPFDPRPVLQAGTSARVLIAGQAPGLRAHASGIPWDDASGERLRSWMDVEKGVFYDGSLIAIVPMAFCYPGRGVSGDCRRGASAPRYGSISCWG